MLRLLGLAAASATGIAAGFLFRELLIPFDGPCACGHHRCFHDRGRDGCRHTADGPGRATCHCVHLVPENAKRMDRHALRANLRDLALVLAD